MPFQECHVPDLRHVGQWVIHQKTFRQTEKCLQGDSQPDEGTLVKIGWTHWVKE